MATVVAPLVICVAGALLYALSANGKLTELGRIAFFCGLFWLTYLLGSRSFHF